MHPGHARHLSLAGIPAMLESLARKLSVVGVAALAAWPATTGAGDCGCGRDTSNCQVVHVYRCRHCFGQPPVGMVVPSAPAFAAPLVAAPAAAPMYAPVQLAPVTYAPQAAPSQCSSSQAAPSSAPGKSQEELAAALLRALLTANGNGASSAPNALAAPAVPPDESLSDRVGKMERRVQDLEELSLSLGKIIKSHEARLNP